MRRLTCLLVVGSIGASVLVAVPARALSPAGMVFQRGGGLAEGQVMVADADGSNIRAVPGLVGTAPALSPDGTTIACPVRTPYGWHVVVVGVDGSGAHPVSSDAASMSNPAWSPDGVK